MSQVKRARQKSIGIQKPNSGRGVFYNAATYLTISSTPFHERKERNIKEKSGLHGHASHSRSHGGAQEERRGAHVVRLEVASQRSVRERVVDRVPGQTDRRGRARPQTDTNKRDGCIEDAKVHMR